MLLTITPNPCIERTLSVPDFQTGSSFRVDSTQVITTLGGKGVNCARVAAALGTPSVAMTFAGPAHREWMDEQMRADGMETELISVSSETRTCLNILHEAGNTEIVESGVELEIASGTEMLQRFAARLPEASLVALCGSYPPATVEAWHLHGAVLCHMAVQSAKRLIYDGYGPAFDKALASPALPWMIKPNLKEASAALQRPIRGRGDEIKAVRDLMRRGIEVVLLSCGARGAYLGHPGGIDWIEAPPVKTVSAVGSGDAMLGAFCDALLSGNPLREAGRRAVAAGSANAATARAAAISRQQMEDLLPQVRLQSCEFTLQPR